jgi:hypothetical protein
MKIIVCLVMALLLSYGITYAQADKLVFSPSKPEKKVLDLEFVAVSSYLVLMTVFDVETTFAVIRNGGHECNPVMKPFTKNRAYMYGVQLGLDALVIYVAYEMKGSKYPAFGKTWWVVPSILGTAHGVAGGMNMRYVF